MAILCVAAERGGLIKEERKESSWVKLKAFSTNVGRPKRRRWPIKSGNDHKNPRDSSEKVRDTMVGRIYGKG